MQVSINEVKDIEIDILSPVAILDGNTLSCYIDIINDSKNKQILVLDIEKIQNQLMNSPFKMDEYLNVLKNKATNKNKFTIGNFLRRNRIDVEKVISRKIPYTFSLENLTEIETCIKSRKYPFIPGSSLKGAIRTAVLVDKCNKNQLIKLINKPYRKNVYVGEDVFRNGESNIQSDIFKYLIIRDTDIDKELQTELIQINSFNIYKCIKENKFKLDIPRLVECIGEGNKLHSQLIIKNKNIFNLNELIDYINNFTENFLLKEISILENFKFNDVSNIENQYKILLNKVRMLKASGKGFVTRIGNSKGFAFNTVAQKLTDEEIFKIAKDNYKKNRGFGKFPTTRWALCDGEVVKETLGWIEVKIVE